MQEIREQLGRIETKLDELMSLKEIVLELTEAKRIERQKERLRKTAMRTAARAERNASSLVLRDNIFKKDVRLREHFKKCLYKALGHCRHTNSAPIWQNYNCRPSLKAQIVWQMSPTPNQRGIKESPVVVSHPFYKLKESFFEVGKFTT